MRKRWLFGFLIVAPVLVAGVALADSDPTPSPATRGQADVPLVLSIRALSLQAPLAETGNADVERVKAPTGTGTSQWPSSSTQLGRGVYLSVMPACIPGVDEPLWPGTQRPGRRR